MIRGEKAFSNEIGNSKKARFRLNSINRVRDIEVRVYLLNSDVGNC